MGLKNEGVADVSVRQDGKIMVSGGWDGRYRSFYAFIFYFMAHYLGLGCLVGKRVNPWQY